MREQDIDLDIHVEYVGCIEPFKQLQLINTSIFNSAKAVASRQGYPYLLKIERVYKKGGIDVVGTLTTRYTKTSCGWICTDNAIAAPKKSSLLAFMRGNQHG